MTQPILFCSANEAYSLQLSTIDERLFMVVEARALPKDGSLLQKVIWWSSDVRPSAVPKGPLLEEVRAVVREIERDSEFLPFAYAHTARMTDSDGQVLLTSGSGLTSGHRLPGDPDHVYAIKSGIGVCSLKKMAIDANGKGVLIDTVDHRRSKKIDTEDEGAVVIKKRKIKTNLGKSFAELQEFLEHQTTETIRISRNDE